MSSTSVIAAAFFFFLHVMRRGGYAPLVMGKGKPVARDPNKTCHSCLGDGIYQQ